MQLALNRYKVSVDSPDDFKIGLMLLRTGMVARNVLTEKDLDAMTQRQGKDGHPLVMDEEIDYYIDHGWILDFRDARQKQERQETRHSVEGRLLKDLTTATDQWPLLQRKTRDHWIKVAQEHPRLEASQRILALAQTTTTT